MAGITGKDAVLTEYARRLETLDAPKGRSLTQDAIRRLVRNTAAVISVFVVAAIVLFAFVGPTCCPGPMAKSTGAISASHPISRPGILPAPTRTAATCWPASCRARR